VDWQSASLPILIVTALLLQRPVKRLLDKWLGMRPDISWVFKPWHYQVLYLLFFIAIAIALQALIFVFQGSLFADFWFMLLGSMFMSAVAVVGWSIVYWIFLRKFHLR
jgi:hypothetical protein